MKIRNVLSLFDGISCGQLALKKAGIEFDTYYASEVDKNPIYITQYNFPNTVQLGDVEKWKEWNIDWSKIDLLIGGSPCTNLSIAGNREGLEGEESRLFYAYVDILNHIKKFNLDVKFLLENVESMSDENKGIINSYMGCKPVMINSALLSAQNRKRYYWVNWCLKKESLFGLPTCVIPQPKDKGIILKNILENTDECAKNQVIHYVGSIKEREEKDTTLDNKYKQTMAINLNPNKTNTLTTVQKDNVIFEKIEPSCLRYERTEEGKKLRKQYEKGEIKCGFNEHRILSPRNDDKTNTLTTVAKDNIICVPICSFVEKKYEEFSKKKGYIPEIFSPYNMTELKEKAPTLTTSGCGPTNINGVVLFENVKSYAGRIVGRKLDENGKRKDCSDLPKTVKVGNTYYDFCENDGTRSEELYYLGGIISKRKKWLEDGKNLSRNFSQGNRVYSVRGKSACLNANGGGLGAKTGLYKINLPDGDYIIRKLTAIECERLQTLPDNYTKYGTENGNKVTISNSARYKALGNGWTVDVIAHIFEFLVKEGI